MTIVKVQRPLSGPPGSFWLIYARDRKDLCAVPERDVPVHVRAKMKDATKAYFNANLHNGDWIIGDPVAGQAW